eukprot:3910525-Rhodomonas_salina.1
MVTCAVLGLHVTGATVFSSACPRPHRRRTALTGHVRLRARRRGSGRPTPALPPTRPSSPPSPSLPWTTTTRGRSHPSSCAASSLAGELAYAATAREIKGVSPQPSSLSVYAGLPPFPRPLPPSMPALRPFMAATLPLFMLPFMAAVLTRTPLYGGTKHHPFMAIR